MDIKPLKLEYDFSIMKHTMRAETDHTAGMREVSFFFDDKLVSKINIEDGDILTDDDCMLDIVHNYCRNNVGVYADILNRHSDKVFIVEKKIDVVIDNSGIEIGVKIVANKERYRFEMSTNNGKDILGGEFEAQSFSDILEKMRFFIYTLDGVSGFLTNNINELSNNEVEKWIKWQ